MALFNSGKILAAFEFSNYLDENPNFNYKYYLDAHFNGNFGDLCASDIKENIDAIKYNRRILSKYTLEDGREIYIITEADRSVTTMMFVEGY